jgi:hypothetical protein
MEVKMPNLTHEELQKKVETIKVGQIYRCLEDTRIILISLVRPGCIEGYIFTGFEVCKYISLAPLDFIRYFTLVLEPRTFKLSHLKE